MSNLPECLQKALEATHRGLHKPFTAVNNIKDVQDRYTKTPVDSAPSGVSKWEVQDPELVNIQKPYFVYMQEIEPGLHICMNICEKTPGCNCSSWRLGFYCKHAAQLTLELAGLMITETEPLLEAA